MITGIAYDIKVRDDLQAQLPVIQDSQGAVLTVAVQKVYKTSFKADPKEFMGYAVIIKRDIYNLYEGFERRVEFKDADTAVETWLKQPALLPEHENVAKRLVKTMPALIVNTAEVVSKIENDLDRFEREAEEQRKEVERLELLAEQLSDKK